MNLDGLSLSPLIGQLGSRLVAARVDRIFQPDKYTLILRLRQPGEDLTLLLSANPEYPRIHLVQTCPENPPVPPSFCMLLRKHLEDGRIARIDQHGLDRVVTIAVDSRGERGLIVTKQLTIEIMGKHSNIIFTQDGIIIDAVKRVGPNISRVRQVLPGREYTVPPGQDRINPLAVPAAELVRRLRCNQTEKKGLSKALIATAVGIGPLTAGEIAWRAGLPGNIPVESIDDIDANSLTEALESVLIPLSQGEVNPTIVVDTAGEHLLGIAAFPLEHLTGHQKFTFSTMSAAVEFAAGFQGKPSIPEKTVLQKLINNELNRVNRKEAVLAQELAVAADADCLRRFGDILMANLYRLNQGSSEAVLPDLYSESPESAVVTIPLDPLRTTLENAKQYYSRYNKLKRALESLTVQLKEGQEELAYLDSIAVSLDQAETFTEIAEIRQELTLAGYVKGKVKRHPETPAAPLTAKTADGLAVLIGKNNRQNDLVTFKQAQPDDLWFHTKDIPGSHVILRCGGREVAAETLTAAATLAAYFSKARQSANVPVDYTLRRYVKKPAGAKPGFVIYDRQKTIYVTPAENIVKKLLHPEQQ